MHAVALALIVACPSVARAEPTPDWTAASVDAGDALGQAVAGAGDVNGDGYADIAVAAPLHTGAAALDGTVAVYLGSSTGPATTPAWSGAPDETGAEYGSLVAGAGDVDGDGFADVLVGAPLYSSGYEAEGAVFLYSGSAEGLAPTPGWTRLGEQRDASASRAAGAGDVNGDGWDDVLVGAPGETGSRSGAGAAWVYLGSGSGLEADAAWEVDGVARNQALGQTVAGAGDTNGDGYADVLVSCDSTSNEGGVALYLGGASGPEAEPAWTAGGTTRYEAYGEPATAAGDVDADGFDDLLVAAPYGDEGGINSGTARVFLGGPDGPGGDAAWTVDAAQAGAELGYTASAAGDLNRDGYADIVLGAPAYDQTADLGGRALAYLGGPDGLGDAPAWTLDGATESAALGTSVAAAGDTNADGYPDLLVGAPGAGDDDAGAAYVYLGSDCAGSFGWGDGDGDGDGLTACLDCNDRDAQLSTDAPEVPGDEVDQNCDGSELCYVDADGDGARSADGATTLSPDATCDAPGEAPFTATPGDCDDADPEIHPGAVELDCTDPTDYDCDGETLWADDDGDGTPACQDCDDADPARSLTATELCNERDDDCDGVVDDDPADGTTGCLDADGDGYTDPAQTVTACSLPDGYRACHGSDCDDGDAGVHPDAAEVADDGVDQDCDGRDELTPAPPTGCGCALGAPSSRTPLGGAVFAAVILAGLSRRRRREEP